MTENPTIDRVIERAGSNEITQLLEAEAKEVLTNAGIRVPQYECVTSPERAVEVAEDIGYPIVLKVSSRDVQHKSEWANGAGVALGIEEPDDVHRAARRIFEAAETASVSAEVLVEAAVDLESGTEVIVAGIHDEAFGPVVMFGLGGTYAEVLDDTAHRLAPIDVTDAREMLEEVQMTELLNGYRGDPPVNRERLAEAIVKIGDLLVEHDALQEVEINPLLAMPIDEPIALDALISLR